MELSYWGISPNIPAWPTDENGERGAGSPACPHLRFLPTQT